MLDMSFLTANFGWILLAVVLFAMLIVGYVADKTDFGHKKVSKKKEIENPNKVEEIDLENLKGKTLKDMVGGSNGDTEAKDINEDLNAPFGDTTENSNEETIDESLYSPIGNEDLNIPFGDTNTSTDIPLDIELTTPISDTNEENKEVSNNDNVVEEVKEDIPADIFAPLTDEPVDNTSTEEVKEVSEDSQSIDELIPEVKIDSIPETEDVLVPIEEENKVEEPVIENSSIEESETEVPETEELVIEEPVSEIPAIEEPVFEEPVSEVPETEEPVIENPVENPEDVILAPMDEAIPSLDTEEVLIPSIDETATENVEVPVEPSIEEVIDTPVEAEDEKSKKKKDKKEKKKHKKEDSNKYVADYEEEIVPEVITEKFNDGSEISSDDDIWKF